MCIYMCSKISLSKTPKWTQRGTGRSRGAQVLLATSNDPLTVAWALGEIQTHCNQKTNISPDRM